MIPSLPGYGFSGKPTTTGWDRAYFNFGTKYPLSSEAPKEAAASCNERHKGNAKTDWVFSQYYPVLRAAVPRSK